jgi:hypothetical protein
MVFFGWLLVFLVPFALIAWREAYQERLILVQRQMSHDDWVAVCERAQARWWDGRPMCDTTFLAAMFRSR